MSLLAAHTLLGNATIRARVESAIRKTAEARSAWEGPPGDLARDAFRTPDAVSPAFMLRLATNGSVVERACPSCGDAAGVTDETIEWIVGDAWDAIASDLYGAPPDTPTE
ncbi:MAG: hypothetical protein Q4G40_09235 [Brachybacterium sp.]|nr:hypothetical protein [Brachybacterium sp.]